MLRIVDITSSGKTRRLLTYAKENHLIVVCSNAARMRDKADRYGLGYVECIAYSDFLAQYKEGSMPAGGYVVDELEKLVREMFLNGSTLEGYNLSDDT